MKWKLIKQNTFKGDTWVLIHSGRASLYDVTGAVMCPRSNKTKPVPNNRLKNYF